MNYHPFEQSEPIAIKLKLKLKLMLPKLRKIMRNQSQSWLSELKPPLLKTHSKY